MIMFSSAPMEERRSILCFLVDGVCGTCSCLCDIATKSQILSLVMASIADAHRSSHPSGTLHHIVGKAPLRSLETLRYECTLLWS